MPMSASVLDHAALEQRPVSEDHAAPITVGQLGGAMDHRVVLDRAAGANLDVRDIAAQHGPEPDVGPVADPDIADQDGGRGEEDILADGRRRAVELDDRRHRAA